MSGRHATMAEGQPRFALNDRRSSLNHPQALQFFGVFIAIFVVLLTMLWKVAMKILEEPEKRLAAKDLPGVGVRLDTALGPVEARTFGKKGAPLVLCIQGKSPKTDVVQEWYPAATALAARGRFVVVPNLHSNPRTKPGDVRSFDLQAILMGVCSRFGAEQAAVLGKSWGGGEALLFAATHPHLVTHLVMVAPSPSEVPAYTLARIEAPCLLFWARDDSVKSVSHAELYTSVLSPSQLAYVEVDRGGHRVLPEYVPRMAAWLVDGKADA